MNQSKFHLDVLLTLWWCNGNGIKTNKVGGSVIEPRNSISCRVQVVLFVQPPTLLLKQNANIVYDSYNKTTWNFSGFFQVLEMYYQGKPELMAEDLVQAVKTMLILKDTILDDELKEKALNLLYLRDAVKEININTN
jgi:hypothetical protein